MALASREQRQLVGGDVALAGRGTLLALPG
jgi:hypothetical protein